MDSNNQYPTAPAQGSQFVDYSKSPTESVPAVPGTPTTPPPPPFDSSSLPPLHTDLKPRRSHKWLWITLVVIVLVLLAGAAYAFMISPDKVVASTLAEIDRATKLHSGFKLQLISENALLKDAYLEIVSETDITSEIKSQVNMDVSAQAMQASGEVRLIGTTLYGQLKSYPQQFMTPDMQGAIGKWYSVNIETLTQLQGSYLSPNIASTTLGMKPASLAKAYETLRAEGVISEPKFAGVGSGSSGLVRKYSFEVDKAALAKFITKTYRTEVGEDQYAAEIEQGVAMGLSNLDISSIVASVAMFSGSLREITGTVKVPQALESTTMGVKGLIGTLSYDNTKTDFQVTVPVGAIAVDTLLLSSLQQSKMKAQTVGIKARTMQIRPLAELFYDKGLGYKGACKDPEIVSIITDLNMEGVIPICRDSAAAYLFAVQFIDVATTSKKYMCIDSKGGVKELAKLAAGYVCK